MGSRSAGSPELLAASREALKLVPLNRLRQQPPKQYLLEAGDVLGVYIEGVLGNANQPPPVRLVEQSSLPPAMGYPVPVREDGTLSLPFVSPIRVTGMTIVEAERAVRQAYTVKKEISEARPGADHRHAVAAADLQRPGGKARFRAGDGDDHAG